MRSCEDFERLLPAYVAGIADPADVAEIGEHIADCTPCMNDFQRVVKDLGTLKSWRDPAPPEGLAARVLERLVTAEEQRKREALGEETSWGEPIQQALTWAALVAVGLAVMAMIVTASTTARYEEKRRECANNLRQIGELAAARGTLAAPLENFQHPDHPLPKTLKEELVLSHLNLLECPVAGSVPDGRWSSYNMLCRGPRYLAGDWRENHRWADANILLNDGSVVTVTPAQATLWDLLDPNSPGR